MTHSGDTAPSNRTSVDKALEFYNAGDFLQAKKIFDELHAASPENPDILVGLGMVMLQTENLPAAEEMLRRAIALHSQHDVACRSLALVFLKGENLQDAEKCALRSVEISPQNAQNLLTLGVIKAALGKSDDAAACYKAALVINPSYPEALHNLGALLMQRREFGAAVELLISAIANRPNYLDAYRKLFIALQESGSQKEAHALLRYIASISPGDRDVQIVLEQIEQTQLREPPASSTSDEQVALDSLAEESNVLIQEPLFADSAVEIREIRESLAVHFEETMESSGSITDPLAMLRISSRLLLSLPLQDRFLRTRLASLLLLKAPSLVRASPHLVTWKNDSPFGDDASPFSPDTLGSRDLILRAQGLIKRKIRVGVCSERFSSVAASSLFSTLLANLPRELFTLHLFCGLRDDRGIEEVIRARADSVSVLPNNLEEAAAEVSRACLDILLYTDPESASLTYFLSFAKLAPIQCALWGNGETTGIPAMNYFIASQTLVTARAQSQFSESLVALSQPTGCSNSSVNRPSQVSSEIFRSEGRVVFLCPEPLEYIHPDTDYLFQRILQGERNNVLVLIERENDGHSTRLLNRLEKAMPDCLNQIVVKKVSCEQECIDLIAGCDVALEPLHSASPLLFSKALSLGKPVVALPGRALRSRISYAFYKQTNYTEVVAQSVEHYIQIALLLARDTEWRAHVTRAIVEAHKGLVDMMAESASELTRFFLAAIHKQHTAELRGG